MFPKSLVSVQPMTAPVGGVFSWEYTYGAEPTIERISNDILAFRRRDDELELTRGYIIQHIKNYSNHDNLRAAIKDVCAEFENLLDKLVILKE